MSYRFLRVSLAGGSAVAMALSRQQRRPVAAGDPGAGETLPEIVVQAPSPIQRQHRHGAQPAAPQPQRIHPQHLHLILRPMPAPCDRHRSVRHRYRGAQMRKSAAARLRPSAIFSITSRASPDHRSRPVHRAADHSRLDSQPRGHCREKEKNINTVPKSLSFPPIILFFLFAFLPYFSPNLRFTITSTLF